MPGLVRRTVAGEAGDDEVGVGVRDLRRGELAARPVPVVDPVHHPEDRDRGELRLDVGADDPLVLPLPDQVAEEAVVEIALLDDHLAALAVERAEVLEEDGHLDEVVGVVREVDDDERADLLQRVALDGGRPVEVLQRLLVDSLDDLEEEVLLGGDVVVEAALQDPDGVGDVLDRGRLVALLVEDTGCGLEDLLLPAARRTRTAALRGVLCLSHWCSFQASACCSTSTSSWWNLTGGSADTGL